MLSSYGRMQKRENVNSCYFSAEKKQINHRGTLTSEVRRSNQRRSSFRAMLFLALAIAGVSQPLGAQHLSGIGPLSFTMPQHGNAPLPQVIEVTSSTSAIFDFAAAASTSSGGNWLAVSPTANLQRTPLPVTVTIDGEVAQSLPVGSYQGNVALTPNNGTAVLTIPVTLTIQPSTVPFFDNLPGGLTFYCAAHAQPAPQSLQVRNGGSGTLNWSATPSTADGGNWLTISPANETAPTIVTVGINSQNLPNGGAFAGLFTGQLIFSSASGSVTVPITVAVGGTNLVQINPLGFVMPQHGQAPLPQTIEVTSSSGTVFDFAAAAFTATGGDWLTVAPTANLQRTPLPVTVSINQAIAQTLSPGTYTGQVIVTPNTGQPALTIPVTLTVAPTSVPFFDNLPGALTFIVQANGSNPASQVLQVRNGGSGTLNWSATPSTADGGNWLTISPASETAPTIVTVGINSQNLPNGGAFAGLFTGQLIFSSANGSVTVPITVAVGGTNLVQINPLGFVMPQHGQAPLPQTIEVTSSSGTVFDFAAAAFTATGGDWLTVAPTANLQRTPLPVTVSINQAIAQTLSPGTYTGQVIVTPNTGQPALTIPVTLTVAPTSVPFFDNLPGALTFIVQANGSNPASQVLQVRNGGSGTLNWSATPSTADGGNWLTISPASETAPTIVTVGINSQNLPNGGAFAGLFTGQLIFSSANGSVTVPITVAVGGTNLVQINPLGFVMPQHGQAPLPQTIEVTSSSGTVFDFAAAAFTATGGDWLTVAPTANLQRTPLPVTVSINQAIAQTLSPGTYTGQVIVTPNTGQPALTIPVTLTVAPTSVPFFDNLPGGLYFSAQASTGNLSSQVVQIRNEGSGQLDWTVIPTTGDGGNWLTVSALSGTDTTNISIGIIAQNLPNNGATSGIYTGQLSFQSANGNITIPITVDIRNDVFLQANGLTFNVPPDGLSQTLTVTSLGNFFDYSGSSSTGNGGNWLTVAPLNPFRMPAVETFTVNTAGLARGTYTGQAVFQSGTVAQTVQVTLNVGGSPPASIVPTSGTPQSAPVNTAFAAPLVVTVNDLLGKPVSGELVTFTAPGSGASVTFTGQAAATATTNSSGQATSPILTANAVLGPYTVSAIVAGLAVPAVFNLTNTQLPLQSIAITAPSLTLSKGSTEPFTATGTYNDSSTANLTSQVNWSSSNSSIASVGTSGLVTALAVGTANITATLSNVTSNSFGLTVTPPVLQSITISAPAASLAGGSTEQFTATGLYQDGSTINLSTMVNWASSNPTTAAVNGTGLLTAGMAGTTTITASLSGVISNSFGVIVTPPPVSTPPTVVSYNVLFGSQSYNLFGSTRNRLPWQITGIQVVFSEPITAGTINSLGGVSATAFSGLGTATLTWTINPLAQGTFATTLSGGGSNALTDSAGIPLANGAGFSRLLKVLSGDFNDDGYVTSADMVGVNNASTGSYDLFADENGDGVVDVNDVQAVRSRLGTSLP